MSLDQRRSFLLIMLYSHAGCNDHGLIALHHSDSENSLRICFVECKESPTESINCKINPVGSHLEHPNSRTACHFDLRRTVEALAVDGSPDLSL